MNFERPEITSLVTESDVEQKLLYPLMVGDAPTGLGYDPADVHTKAHIRKFTIGKGSDQKSYFPDYIVVRGGLPILVAEAKKPGTDLAEAFREARLYAAELNALYPTGIQPVTKVLIADGNELHAGKPDHNQPLLILQHSEIAIYSTKFAKLLENYSSEALQASYIQLLPLIRPRRYWKPRKLVGGVSFQREEIGANSFGATISADFAHIFNPQTLTDRNFIAKNGYISSKRRERYVEPIDRVIRASTPPSEARSVTLVF